jgi:hypothetical protein
MRPLSERLQHESEAGWGEDLAGLLREAAALAKRYEDAPVQEVGALPGTNGGFGAVCLPREYVGQRVRLVVEGGEG